MSDGVTANNEKDYNGIMKVVNMIDAWFMRFEKLIMFVASVLLFGLILSGVFLRYFLYIPMPYQEELAAMFHVWMCFMGVSYLMSSDGHPAVEVLSSRIRESSNIILKKIYFTIIYLIMFFFVVLACIYGFTQVPMYLTQVTTYLGISYIYRYGGGILGMLLMSIRCLLKIVEIWAGEKYDR